MRLVVFILLLGVGGCYAAPVVDQPQPRVIRDRRPEVLSRTITGDSPRFEPQHHAHPPMVPTTSPTGDVFPVASVSPLARPIQPTDPSRFAPQPDRGWDRRSPTEPASPFDRRFDRRNRYDDLNRMDPSHRDPPASVWERDFDPQRK